MRWRPLLLLSLVANLVLAAGWYFTSRQHETLYRRAIQSAPLAPTQIKTNVVIRRQFFSWQELESSDYRAYVTNLRDIGCPEQTIRDIIIADVNALYARKRATDPDIITPEHQWWRSEPDTDALAIAVARIRELDEERRGLLTSLLGADWETGDQISLPRPSRPGLNLDGPILGTLPNDIKQEVQEIAARAQDRVEAYTEAQRQAGTPLDPSELARIQQQTRLELASVLTPPQLEEYLLRYSQNAAGLRTELGGLKHFDASQDEFRAMFQATDSIDLQLQLLGNATDNSSVQLREALLAQREDALKRALKDRYEQYRLLHDPVYRDAYATALQAGDPNAALTLYEINQTTAEELTRIRANTNISSEQLAIELKKAELEQLKALAQALGQEVPEDPPPAPKPQPKKVHVLSPGESLSFLSRLYGVNPDALRAANPNLNLDRLKPGDSVSVPINLLPPVPALPPQ
jgi:LysM repeat protein